MYFIKKHFHFETAACCVRADCSVNPHSEDVRALVHHSSRQSLTPAVISGEESEKLLMVTGTSSGLSGSVCVVFAWECDSVYVMHHSLSLFTISKQKKKKNPNKSIFICQLINQPRNWELEAFMKKKKKEKAFACFFIYREKDQGVKIYTTCWQHRTRTRSRTRTREYLRKWVCRRQQNVLRLEVTVNDVLEVEMTQSHQDLKETERLPMFRSPSSQTEGGTSADWWVSAKLHNVSFSERRKDWSHTGGR